MEYQLLATDMDGTLLNEKKKISAENQEAVNRALDMGKDVIFSTGRSLSETEPYFAAFPKMRYLLCESGALLYDIRQQKILDRQMIQPSVAEEILTYTTGRDVLLQIMMKGKSMFEDGMLERLQDYQNDHLRELFRDTGTFCPNVIAYCREHGWQAEKICIYHSSPEEREITLQHLQHLPVTMAFSEKTSLEITPAGIDKGTALKKLCDLLDMDIQQVIAVGDAPNDHAILETAGLAVAMGNAIDSVRQLCQTVVADNDHHGVKEAIDRYLLHE